MKRIIAFVFGLMVACPALASEQITPRAVQEAQLRNGTRSGTQADPLVVKAQILLDRAGFSPGEIDGRRGENFRKSVRAFARSKGIPGVDDLTPMETYVFPTIGSTPVAEVSTAQVLKVLTPIWFTKPETAKRVMQRMEAVFKSAIVRGARKAASPCIGVADELGTKHRVVNHHASMPWGDVPNLIQLLHAPAPRRMHVTSLALEFLILTATRSGETRGAAWSEFDTERALWVIPPERMKARERHRVPLSKRCLEILAELSAAHPRSELVFPSRTGKPLSDMTLTKLLRDETIEATPHGFRSSFKVWASECAKVPHEVSEAALAHSLGSKVVAAYLRTDFLEERRPVMQAWADYCLGGRAQGRRSAEAREHA